MEKRNVLLKCIFPVDLDLFNMILIHCKQIYGDKVKMDTWEKGGENGVVLFIQEEEEKE